MTLLERLPMALLLGLGLALAGCPTTGDDDDDDSSGDDDDDDDSVSACEGIEQVSGTDVAFESFASGFSQPVALVPHPTQDALLVVELPGRIIALDLEGNELGTFLDIAGQVDCCGENGMLGLAFHPDFADNGLFYVHYDTPSGAPSGFDSRVSEFSVSSDPLVADTGSERVLMEVPQPFGNHNGGQLAFGPDDMLYIALGDGGGAGDSACTGSDGSSMLAKILRIDPTPDGSSPYTIPADNPFVGDASVVDETWAWGLRNPWQFSFDRETGDMWIADVGQNAWEEINIGEAGAHYGWSFREGRGSYNSGCPSDVSNAVDPVFQYPNSFGASVTGGYVYRGCRMPDLHGRYFFADAVLGWVQHISWDGGDSAGNETEVWSGQGFYELGAFGQDLEGELYVLKLSAGQIFKMVPAN